ncbi:glycoside hydrolase family 1 protein [Arthrobacter woluwensis]|uniref:glycoside hydrolase family 1 protein n=1 Tax=Arthrobacter woluwensis TaxID=156980 RepID=UPI0016437B3A
MSRPFPEKFLFGAATAAYQIEGAAFDDGRTASIWDAFSRVPGAVVNGDTGDVACDHYNRYPQDVALMRELGLQSYRFSASWSRVRPDGGAVNPAGVAFYDRLVDELLEAGILPWLTLYHWDMPQALEEKGGWTVRETSDRFVEYGLTLHDALGDRVRHWTTLNEPWCSSFLSYTAGAHAPGRYDVGDGLLAAHHLLLAHGRTIEALRERDDALEGGITLNLTVADAADPQDPADLDAARKIDGQFNRWFLDPVLQGSYPEDTVEDIRAAHPEAVTRWEAAVRDGDLASMSTPLDWLGVNYYHGELVSGHAPRRADERVPGGDALVSRRTESPFPAAEGVHWVERGLPRTGMDWEVQPDGLRRVLQRVAESAPGLPLYVTENGAAYDDELVDGRVPDTERTAFLKDHLGAVLAAIDAGADVRGYFYWSLLDNYEWAWGYEKRFGIVRVDYETQERLVKDSGLEYRRIIAERAV